MKHKYGAKKTIVDGNKFASKKESKRYMDLMLLEKAKLISELQLQPRFCIQEAFKYKGKRIQPIYYVADFQYWDETLGKYIVEDVKGFKTQVYNLKRKMFLKLYGDIYIFQEVM